MNTNTGGKTAIYLRQSLDRDQTQLAVERQREACLDLCRRRGWADTVEYVDNDTSASTGRRPHYEQMLADIESGAVRGVVVWHLDRLHRRPIELEQFMDLAKRRGLALATVTGDVDLSTDDGQFMARVMAAVARKETDRKAARQKAANAQRAKAGKAWNERTFGYDGDEIVPEEAEALRTACRDLLNGASLRGIAADWNARGLRTAKGSMWTGSQLRQVFLRARNAGLVVYDVKRAQAEARKRGEAVHLAGIVEGATAAWPAIIDRETWESVCQVLTDPKRFTGKTMGRKHLLSGIAVCGVCGRSMGTTVRRLKSGGNRPVYACKRQGCMGIVRDLEQTDALVVDVITRRLSRPDAAAALARPSVDTEALRDQINALRAQIAAAEAEYDEGLIDGRRLKGRIERVSEKLQPLENRLLGSNTARVLDGLAGAPDAPERFAALGLDRQRAVISTLCEVTIETQSKGGRFDPSAIRIDWK